MLATMAAALLAQELGLRYLHLFPDSIGYVAWPDMVVTPGHPGSPPLLRTPGYPVVLRVMEFLFGDLSPLPAVQLALLVASTAFLGAALGWTLRSALAAFVFIVAVGSAGRLQAFAFALLTESTFVAASSVGLAFLVLAVRTPRVVLIAAAATMIGIACAIRPAGLGLLPVLLVPLLWTPHRLRGALAAAVPVGAIMLAGSVAAARGDNRGAVGFGMLNMSAYVGWMLTPADVAPGDTLVAEASARTASIRDAVPPLPLTPGAALRRYETIAHGYIPIMFEMLSPVLMEDARRKAGISAPEWTPEARAHYDVEARRLTLKAVMSHPLQYAHLVALNWAVTWAFLARTPPVVAQFTGEPERQALLEITPGRRLRDEPGLATWFDPELVRGLPSGRTLMERLRRPIDLLSPVVALASVIGSLVGIVALPTLRRRGPALRLVALGAVALQGSVMLVVLPTCMLHRYVDPLYPLAWLTTIALVAAIGHWLRHRRGTGEAVVTPVNAGRAGAGTVRG